MATHTRALCTRAALALLLTAASCGDDSAAQTGTTSTGATSPGTTPGTTAGTTANTSAETAATSSPTTGAATDTTTDTGEPHDPKPSPPRSLVHYITGDPEDADVKPTGPALILMGGGADVDQAFAWWGQYLAGGDVVVLRASGADGYNDYLYDFGNASSIETMLVPAELAADPYVLWTLRHAEAIWLPGGDQANYLNFWRGTPIEDELQAAWARGAVLGGTSAGLAVLGEFIYAAYNDSVYSYEALEDPYNDYMTLERDFLQLSPLAGVITDSHFGERDRMGRLIGFLARLHADGWASAAVGIGVDEATAVLIPPDGEGEVIGAGHVYIVRADQPPLLCEPAQFLDYPGLEYHTLAQGDALHFPGAIAEGSASPLAAAGGVTMPADPYP